MPNGSFAGGLAGGFASGTQIGAQLGQVGLTAAKIKASMAATALDAKKFEIDYWKSAEPRFAEALAITDPSMRSLTLKALFADSEQKLGKKAPPLLIDFFKQDPIIVQKALTELNSQGATLAEVAFIGADPGTAAVGLTALAKRLRTQQGAAAIAGIGEADAPHPTEAVSAPTSALEAAAILARKNIAGMRERLRIAVEREAPARSIQALQASIDEREKFVRELTTGPALAEAERGAAVVSPEVLREIGGAPGTRQRDLPAFGGRTGAPVAPAVSGTAPAATAPGAPRFRTPQQKLSDERRAKPAAEVFGAAVGREAGQAGLRTTGEVEDAIAGGRFRPLSPEERKRLDDAAGAGEALALDKLKKWSTARDTAVEMRGALSLMASSLAQAGATGKIAGPVREALMQVGVAFGVKPDALAALETTESLSIFLASQTLKDFTGNDSDREFMAAIQRNPGLRKQPDTNARLIRIALHNGNMQTQRADFADKWRANFGTLTSKHPVTKRDFDTEWNLYRNAISPVVAPEVLERLQKGVR